MLGTMLEGALIRGLEGLGSLFHGHGKPPGSSSSGLVLGSVSHPFHPEISEKAAIDDQSRLKHVYILGSTGSGKTKLIESLIRQDISAANGFALVDPHGDLTQSILSFLAAFPSQQITELGRRLLLIEPFNQEWAFAFNPLEADQPFSAALELLEILKRFWSDSHWGPRMDEVLRNTLVTLSQNNLTLLEARPLLTQPAFRQSLVEKVTFGEVRDYWLYRFNRLSEAMQATYREPVLNKISSFLADPAIYRILGQRQSTISFRQAMDQGNWVLLNLSKGRLKDNIRILGAMFIAKIKQAALSRIDVAEAQRPPFYLFIDEFHNFIGEDFQTIISEARKFHLGLTLAHQNLDQLSLDLKSVILGNVGTEIFFRLSHQDASRISSEMDQKEKHLIERRLIDLKVGQAYLKLKGQKAMLLKTAYISPAGSSDESLEEIKRASFVSWSRPVAQVEREIQERRGLWENAGAEERPRAKPSKVRSVKESRPLALEGSFEEGQNEW